MQLYSYYITNESWQLGRHLQRGAGRTGAWSSSVGARLSVGCCMCREILCGSCCPPLAHGLLPTSSSFCAQQHPCSSPCSFSKVVASSGMSAASPQFPHLHARSAQSLCSPILPFSSSWQPRADLQWCVKSSGRLGAAVACRRAVTTPAVRERNGRRISSWLPPRVRPCGKGEGSGGHSHSQAL